MAIYVNRVDVEEYDGTPASVQRIVEMLKAVGLGVFEYGVKSKHDAENGTYLRVVLDDADNSIVVVSVGGVVVVDHGDVSTMSRSALQAEGYEPEVKAGLAGLGDALFGPRYSTEPRS